MALNGTALGTEIFQALKDAGHIPSDNPGQAEAVWQIIATKVVEHVTTNAVVSTTDNGGDTGTGTIS